MFPRLREPEIEMHGVPRNEVERLLEASAGILLDIRESNSAGKGKGFQSCVSKTE